ncbi:MULTISPECIES: lectin like domain-containing protein [Dethiosulfovibrio]|uniref:Lectin like domain-containing protein n=2 Tax=Dethiosulfovibrio TaxID=47054 RepID=A0ABS9EM16_9BACT|nr:MULTISPECIES: lectin like domain-containing protein [Dethiosulfovibrio]MCF4113180.1 lectin like domain-containing protein [Dethiosulfovibrio russensis]MCF4142244.1 lectin like domain-containing protein [Dethiosulfovibrio marinus]MCF4144552.1 lectin like domain-containing protein [Dethiosulfovibrio acidaminovorans]
MKTKKYVRLFSCFLCLLLWSTASWAAEMAPLNPAFESYMEDQADEGKNASDKPHRGRIPSPVDLSHLAGVSVLRSDGKAASSFPVSYDLRPLGLVSPVRDQSPYGACWTFSAMASMESTALKAGVANPDYAEQFLAYYGYVDQTSELVGFGNYDASDFPDLMDKGGDDFKAIALLARGTGAVNEVNAPYGSTAPSATAPISRALRDVYYFYYDNDTRYQKASVENIKTALMNYGAVSIGMFANNPQGGSWDSSPYYNPSTYASYTPSGNPDGLSIGSANHAVTVVGWDDSYSKSNFNSSNQPSSDGAWIVKNSWGSGWGDGGYFYLSYEDAVMDTGAAYVGGDPASYDRVYQYDPFGWCGSYAPSGMVDNTAWMANVFTATVDTDIKAVSFYVGGVGNTYEISVYTGVTGGPTTGTADISSQTGTLQEPGYHTVHLSSVVSVKAGTKFSVVVKVKTPGYDYPIASEGLAEGYSDKASTRAGQSYFSSNGTYWKDITSVNKTANVCLKALGTVTGTKANGSLTITITPQDAADAGARWSVDGGNTWNTSGRNLSLDPGEYTVIFDMPSGWADKIPETYPVVTGVSNSYSSTAEEEWSPFGSGGGCSVGFTPAALLLGLPMLALFGRR